MKYFNDQNTDGYTPEQLDKMNHEIENLINENGWDAEHDDMLIKNASEGILATMDSRYVQET
jgi:hypothetical protein